MEKIKDTIFKFLHLDNLLDNLSGYLETRLELYKLEVREDVARILSKAVVYIILFFFGFLFLMFFSIGLAHFINIYFQGAYVGYWIISSVYGLAFLLFIIFRKSMDKDFERRFMEMTKRKVK
jgi:uncharacterized membrane protein YqjE